MAIADSFLPEFDHEMATTRTMLERVPASNADWKPHPKSTTLGNLTAHLSNLPHWVEIALQQDEFDTNPPGAEAPRGPGFESVDKTLETFDRNVKAARDLIAGASDEMLMQPWTLKNGGNALFSIPRAAVLRSFVLNHIIHHRGQLSVYLRLNDVPLPSVYGPTADMQN